MAPRRQPRCRSTREQHFAPHHIPGASLAGYASSLSCEGRGSILSSTRISRIEAPVRCPETRVTRRERKRLLPANAQQTAPEYSCSTIHRLSAAGAEVPLAWRPQHERHASRIRACAESWDSDSDSIRSEGGGGSGAADRTEQAPRDSGFPFRLCTYCALSCTRPGGGKKPYSANRCRASS